MKRHALFVGVNNYADPSIQKLAFPSEDATELAVVFRQLLKFDRVEKLINPKHSPDVVDAVKDMTRGLGAGDLFLFFFAGHGFRVKENHVLVCAQDEYADLEDEYAGLPVGRLKKRMRGPWNRMLVLDACQNDIRATRGVDCGVATRDLELIHARDDGVPGAGFQIVITSCSEGQKALEVSDLKHGLFTSAFLNSITSFANSRRRIDLEGLRADLGVRMGDLIVRYRLDGRQEPMFTMPTDAGGIILLDGIVRSDPQPSPQPAPQPPPTLPRNGRVARIVLPGGGEMEMIWCEPGEFVMGSPEGEEGRRDEERPRRVKLTKGFWLGKNPVTQQQWQGVMGNNPARFKGGDRPVECVSWLDCMEFIRRVNVGMGYGVRLPTEADWEYACRAGTETPFSWGSTLNGDRANCDGRHPYGTARQGAYVEGTTPVGQYGANPWGFFDMHGNVWEWCSDWYGSKCGKVDPAGPASGTARIRRGGSWFNGAADCRSAFCDYSDPSDKSNRTGFRLCCPAGDKVREGVRPR